VDLRHGTVPPFGQVQGKSGNAVALGIVRPSAAILSPSRAQSFAIRVYRLNPEMPRMVVAKGSA
jgi:hypothetical protein